MKMTTKKKQKYYRKICVNCAFRGSIRGCPNDRWIDIIGKDNGDLPCFKLKKELEDKDNDKR